MKDRLTRLLELLGRYTRLDMIYFAGGSFWQSFGGVGGSLAAIGLLLLFANFLPKETYGTYRYLLALMGFLNIFTLTGMNEAIMQATATGREGALRTAFSYQLRWNLLVFAAALAIGGYYFFQGNETLAWGVVLLGFVIPFINAFNSYGSYLAGKKEFRLNNIFTVLSSFIYAGGMAAAIFLSGAVLWLVIAYAAATLLSSAFFYYATVRTFKPPKEPKEKADGTLRFGRHLTYINLMATGVGQLDSIILNHFFGTSALAVYAIAMAIPNRAIPFIKDWVDLAFPKVAQKTPEEINKTFYLRIGQGVLFGAFWAGVYALAAPYVFVYLMPQYLDAVFYTQLLALNFIFAMPNRFVTVLLNSQRMTARIFGNNLAQSFLRLLSYVFLGIWGGILGLVIAQVLNTFLAFLINIAAWRLPGRGLPRYAARNNSSS